MREIEIRILKNQIRLAKYLPHEKYQVKIKNRISIKSQHPNKTHNISFPFREKESY